MVDLDWSLVFGKLPNYLQGASVTLQISFLTIIFGLLLGIVLALMQDSKLMVIRELAHFYIWVWRGTPLMV
jgi:His/Glu/Gln/Arg/opine family amino acid ABC transporter permease subunit